MTQSFLIGKFWNPEHVTDALKQLKEEKVHIHDVYSPFPLHGVEPYLNVKRSRLTTAAFVYGVMGFFSAIVMFLYINGYDWPINVGGKPNLGWLSFVPITFELTVLFASHGMVITFFIIANYWPGKQARLFDIRQTDDVIVIAIDKSKVENAEQIKAIMKNHGAFEVSEAEETSEVKQVVH